MYLDCTCSVITERDGQATCTMSHYRLCHTSCLIICSVQYTMHLLHALFDARNVQRQGLAVVLVHFAARRCC